MTSSMSESWDGSLRSAASASSWPVSWADGWPMVTVVVRWDPVVRGPDVAPVWPWRSRAWKARPVPSFRPDPRPMAQVRSVCNGPLLTVRDRQIPTLRARGGHGRRERTQLRRSSDGHKLNRRVRPVHDDHVPRWHAPAGRAAVPG